MAILSRRDSRPPDAVATRMQIQLRRHVRRVRTSASARHIAAGQASLAGTQAPRSSGLRIGFTVGRVLGGAVQRNRMKRRLREAVRLSRPWPVVDVDVVVNPKKTVLTLSFDAVLNEIQQALVVIEKKLAKSAEGRVSGSRKP